MWKYASVTVTDNIHELDLVGCTKWTKVVQYTVLVGLGLWVTCYGDLKAWSSITWSILSGPDAVFSRPMAMG